MELIKSFSHNKQVFRAYHTGTEILVKVSQQNDMTKSDTFRLRNADQPNILIDVYFDPTYEAVIIHVVGEAGEQWFFYGYYLPPRLTAARRNAMISRAVSSQSELEGLNKPKKLAKPKTSKFNIQPFS